MATNITPCVLAGGKVPNVLIAHSNQLRAYHIDADGIHIGAMLADQEGLLGGRPTLKHKLQRETAATGTVVLDGANRVG